MFRFKRKLILPLFLQKRVTMVSLARKAKVNFNTAVRAVNGLPITAGVVDKIAQALGIDPLDYLETPVEELEY